MEISKESLDSSIKQAEETIKQSQALARLRENKDFQYLFEEVLGTRLPIYYTQVIGSVTLEEQKEVALTLSHIGFINVLLNDIAKKGLDAQKELQQLKEVEAQYNRGDI